MSIKIMCMIWNSDSSKINGIEKSILLRMADFAADDGSQIFPTIDRIIRDTGFSRTTIIKYLKSLIDKKLIDKRERKKSNGQSISSKYVINVALLERWKLPELYPNKEGAPHVPTPPPGRVRHATGEGAPREPHITTTRSINTKNNNKVLGNNSAREASNKSNVVVLDEGLVNELTRMGASEKNIADWTKYGTRMIREKLALMHTAKPDSWIAWLTDALKNDYQASSAMPKPKKSGPHETPEESNAYLIKIKEQEKRLRTPEQQLAARNGLKEVKKLLGKANDG